MYFKKHFELYDFMTMNILDRTGAFFSHHQICIAIANTSEKTKKIASRFQDLNSDEQFRNRPERFCNG